MRIAVLGDIHANIRALKEALNTIDSEGFDKLILLGDLLTYGVDVVEVIDLVGHRLENGNTVLLRGNHDALYRDLFLDRYDYYDSLPAWIRESVDWTMHQIPCELWNCLEFKDEFIFQAFLFSHANPYGTGRWEYLNSDCEHYLASQVLTERKFSVGVFGHTHRPKWYRCFDGMGEFKINSSGILDSSAVHILNAGSIGQTRQKKCPTPAVLWIQCDGDNIVNPSFRIKKFKWDVSGHLQALACSGMSESTIKRLSGFFTIYASNRI